MCQEQNAWNFCRSIFTITKIWRWPFHQIRTFFSTISFQINVFCLLPFRPRLTSRAKIQAKRREFRPGFLKSFCTPCCWLSSFASIAMLLKEFPPSGSIFDDQWRKSQDYDNDKEKDNDNDKDNDRDKDKDNDGSHLQDKDKDKDKDKDNDCHWPYLTKTKTMTEKPPARPTTIPVTLFLGSCWRNFGW